MKIFKAIFKFIKFIFRTIRHLILTAIVLIFLACAALVIFELNYSEKVLGASLATIYYDARSVIENSTEDSFTLNETSYIYDVNGDLMTKLSSDSSQNYTEYEDIPENVINAFVAVEDKTFWENKGFDLKGIARAAYSYVSTGEITQGGSTITQQLMKLTFLSSEKTLTRKTKEIIMAYYATEKYSKEQIMEWYVNQCCFANGIYGIGDAAYAYLGKSLDELSLAETVYLCCIPNSPEYYNPWKNPENAIDRMKIILQAMYEQEYITLDEYKEALSATIDLTYNVTGSEYDDTISYAIYCSTEYLMVLDGFEFQTEFNTDEEYDSYWESYNEAYAEAKNNLYTGGYEIYTSIDPEAQEALQGYLDETLSFDTALTDDGTYNLQGSATVVDNITHKVIAISGGRSTENEEVSYGINRAFQITRQPGSSIKPLLVYGPAVDNGYDKNSTLYNIDVQTAYEYYTDKEKSVDVLTGTAYSLGTAVTKSYNGCAVYLYNKITPQVGLSYVYQLGLSHLTKDDQYLSAALGGLTYGTNTLEMAGAYSTFPSYGSYTKPDCILSILDSDGNEIYEQAEGVQVYKKNTAIQMAEILEGPIKSGTASSMKWYSSTDIKAGGKTGTTQYNADGWFCGFTDAYTIAVWVGTDDNSSVSGMQGGTYPAAIWKNIMLWLLENRPVEIEESIFDAELDKEENTSQIAVEALSEEELKTLTEQGTVMYTSQAANVRSGPGTEYDTVFVVSGGRAVAVIEYGEYWSEIYVDGQIGWIYSPFLTAG